MLMHDVNMNTHHVAFQYNASRIGLINHRQEEAKTLQSIARMNTKVSSVHQAVGALSGGNQQKIVLSKWLEKTPRILLLDEPTRGVDEMCIRDRQISALQPFILWDQATRTNHHIIFYYCAIK